MPNLLRRVIAALPRKQAGTVHITPIQLNRITQDSQTRKDAIAEAERAYFPFRYKMQQMFLNTTDNGHIKACIERRKDLTMLREWYFGAPEMPDDAMTAQFNQTWFTNFISHAMDAMFYGYSLIELGDLVDGKFPDLKIVKRWNISPDRYEVCQFPYMLAGVKFMEDPLYKDWYVYIDTPNDIGTSPCGYGMLYDISIYEIFLRNLLGFNGSFVELFAQPFRWGKTLKTTEAERAEFATMLQNIGSSGWGMGDPGDEIEFKETALGGTGYKGYDNLEARLQKMISKVILGHADALDSVPGKLGAGMGENSPVYKALVDKQTKDGGFVENIINDILLPQLRTLGLPVPEGCKFYFMNDAEEMELANSVSDLAVKIKSAGLQMTAEYFTEQTGIPVELIPAPAPFGGGFSKSIQNKLKAIYNHKH